MTLPPGVMIASRCSRDVVSFNAYHHRLTSPSVSWQGARGSRCGIVATADPDGVRWTRLVGAVATLLSGHAAGPWAVADDATDEGQTPRPTDRRRVGPPLAQDPTRQARQRPQTAFLSASERVQRAGRTPTASSRSRSKLRVTSTLSERTDEMHGSEPGPAWDRLRGRFRALGVINGTGCRGA
jgi:hypothetical protein